MNKLQEKRPEEFKRLNEYIVGYLKITPEELVNDANLESDLGCDDLDKLFISIEAEAVFDCSIPVKKIYEVSKLGDLYECILNCLNRTNIVHKTNKKW
jgi:acyl carrier protein